MLGFYVAETMKSVPLQLLHLNHLQKAIEQGYCFFFNATCNNYNKFFCYFEESIVANFV